MIGYQLGFNMEVWLASHVQLVSTLALHIVPETKISGVRETWHSTDVRNASNYPEAESLELSETA